MSTEIAEKISKGQGKVLNGLNPTQLQRLVLLQRVGPSRSALRWDEHGPWLTEFSSRCGEGMKTRSLLIYFPGDQVSWLAEDCFVSWAVGLSVPNGRVSGAPQR